ncbi:MAG: 50S ribosome-binding GTPase, partial [Planctomycetales bacterium]|nr:50S ribosome-binding GTPase [Planctomycetales bacterium]
GAIVFGAWQAEGAAEELVVCRIERDIVEIHCHGGEAPTRRIFSAMQEAGCTVESTSSACEMPRLDACVAEAAQLLAHAATLRTAAILWDQAQGAMASEVVPLATAAARGAWGEVDATLKSLLERSCAGTASERPMRVVLAGKPNAGKSSLVNALAGFERSIVYDYPGVTRDALAVDVAVNGWPLQLIDVAGLGDSRDPLASAAEAEARRQIARADLVLWVFDATLPREASGHRAAPPGAATEQLAQCGVASQQVVLVANKSDLVDVASRPAFPPALWTSAISGEGLGELRCRVLQSLELERHLAAGAAVPCSLRQRDALKRMAEAAGRCDAERLGDAVNMLLRNDAGC